MRRPRFRARPGQVAEQAGTVELVEEREVAAPLGDVVAERGPLTARPEPGRGAAFEARREVALVVGERVGGRERLADVRLPRDPAIVEAVEVDEAAVVVAAQLEQRLAARAEPALDRRVVLDREQSRQADQQHRVLPGAVPVVEADPHRPAAVLALSRHRLPRHPARPLEVARLGVER